MKNTKKDLKNSLSLRQTVHTLWGYNKLPKQKGTECEKWSLFVSNKKTRTIKNR